MRKIKSTALLGAFVAVASVASIGVISHEAHGATLSSVSSNIAKEILPGSVTLPTPAVNPGVNYPPAASVTLTLSGATFVSGSYYAILGAGSSTLCSYSEQYSGLNSLTLSNCSLTAGASYTIVGGPNSTLANNTSFIVSGSQATNSIVLSYSSNVSSITGNDVASPVTLAYVMPQLSVSPNSLTTAVISPSSLSTFTNGFTSATNAVVISNSAYNNSNIWGSNTISANDTINFLFTGIPSSVTGVSATDTATNTPPTPQTPGNASATVPFTLNSASSPFKSASSDTIYFSFSNSGNIQTGTISLSSIVGTVTGGSYSSVTYLSTPQNFLTFTIGGTQIYVPDALAPDSNGITAGYITISMPSSASIASISVLNTGVSCSVSSLSLANTGTTNVSYIDLSQLPSLCPGITPKAWGSGVPLVININGTNATPTNITADAYAVFNGMLKRIPVNVVNIGSSSANFSY